MSRVTIVCPGLSRPIGTSPPRIPWRKVVSKVKMTCPKCKQVQEVDVKTATCSTCRTVLRRCIDCSQYDVRASFCRAVNRAVTVGETHYPTYASASTYCREFTPASPPT